MKLGSLGLPMLGKPARGLPMSKQGWGDLGPLALGSALKTFVRADSVKGRTAAQFVRANTEFLSHAGNATLRGQSGTGGWWRAGWVYLDTVAATNKNVLSCLSGNTGTQFYIATATPTLKVGNGAALSTATWGSGLSAATWYFFYIYYDGTNIGVSIDDAAAVTATLSTYDPGAAAFQLGANAGANTFDGRLQNVCGGDGVLSGAQRTALYNAGAGINYSETALTTELLFWFPMTEESGNRTDSKGALVLTDNNTVTANDGKVAYTVTADASVVAIGTDQGASALVIQQTTHTKKPLLKTNIINGQAVLRFDGTDDFLKVATGAISNQPLWGWCVVDDNDAATRFYLDGGAASKVALRHDGTNLEVNAGSDVGAAHTAGAPHLVTFKVNGASSQIWVDGVSLATGDAGAQNQDSGVAVGSDNAGASPLAGDIAEFAFVAGSPTALDIANLKSYIVSRYGLTVA